MHLEMPQRKVILAAAFVLALALSAGAQDASFSVLHVFNAPGDGIGPTSGVILDSRGNLYGVTGGGGNTSCEGGCGTIYELSPLKNGTWSESILYQFGPYGSGAPVNPSGGLAMDPSGNLYGVTVFGGANNRGAAFELSPGANGWTETILYSFCSQPGCADGDEPSFAPVLDPPSNLYGTAGDTAYELSPGLSGWTETVLYTFCSQPNCSDGGDPHALVRDAAGNLYGPAWGGGPNNAGLIFSLRPKPGGGWAYVVLHDFGLNGRPGDGPSAVDLHGAGLYGDTVDTMFELSASGRKVQEKNLRLFSNSEEGSDPEGNLAFDSAGNIYGATAEGGSGCGGGCGTVFEMTPGNGGTWQYQVLHDFTGQDGELPQWGVISDGHGHLFGTTLGGGAPYYGGVVFEITPPTGPEK